MSLADILGRYPTDQDLTSRTRRALDFYRVAARECFDGEVLRHVRLASASPVPGGGARVVFEWDMTPTVSNLMGNVHGGAVATAADILSSFAATADELRRGGTEGRTSVSVALNSEYLRPLVPEGTATVVATCTKSGQSLINLDWVIFDAAAVLCAKGSHIKSVIKSKV